MSFALIPGLPTVGGPELIIFLVIILLLFGAKRIPELARGLGSGVREFKKGTQEDRQVEDNSEKKGEELSTDEAKTETRVEDGASAEADRAEQKRH